MKARIRESECRTKHFDHRSVITHKLTLNVKIIILQIPVNEKICNGWGG